MEEIGSEFRHKVVLCFLDDVGEDLLIELNYQCCFHNFALILCFSQEEVVKYIEGFVNFNPRTDSWLIEEKIGGSGELNMNMSSESILSSLPSITKTNSWTLSQEFKSLHGLVEGGLGGWLSCEGIGERKGSELKRAFLDPLMEDTNQNQDQNQEEEEEENIDK